jgi:hypothetical protein
LSDKCGSGPPIKANRLLTDYFRCPDGLANLAVSCDLSADSGFFRFGLAGICYGQCSSSFGTPAAAVTDHLLDACDSVVVNGSLVQLPFDPVQIVNNLYYERYRCNSTEGRKEIKASSFVRQIYYLARPLLPVAIRKHLQKRYFRGWDTIPFPVWPVDFSVESILEQLLMISMKSQNVRRVPFIWFWPEGAPSCATVTHDVETASGRDFCSDLMDLNDSFGIKTAFQVVPEKRYAVPQSYLDSILERGFELNVHDLNHDGHLMEHREEFLRRAEHINRYGLKFGAQGFRAAMLHRNLDWYDALEFSYDLSVPNVAHLDPQRGGCCTVFPFFNGRLLELPVTMTQDYTLFHILNDYSIDLWKEQISLIRQRHGLMQVIIHPDYIIDKVARDVYAKLLGYLAELRACGETWIALPCEVAVWWRLRAKLRLVNEGGSLRIEGEGKERARIAFATIVDGRLQYEIEQATEDSKDSSNHSSNAIEDMAV